MKKYVVLAAIAMMSVAAFAENIQTIVYTPNPAMVCQNCEKKIKNNIRFVKGTKKIETSLANQTVTITYDADKAKPADYVEAFAKIGREVKEVKAEPAQAAAAGQNKK